MTLWFFLTLIGAVLVVSGGVSRTRRHFQRGRIYGWVTALAYLGFAFVMLPTVTRAYGCTEPGQAPPMAGWMVNGVIVGLVLFLPTGVASMVFDLLRWRQTSGRQVERSNS